MDLAKLMVYMSFIGTSGATIFYVIINIIFRIVNIHVRVFDTCENPSTVLIMMKYIKNSYIFSSSIHGDDIPIGIVFGKWYMAFITSEKIPKHTGETIGYTINFWTSKKGHIIAVNNKFVKIQEKNILEVWRHTSIYQDSAYELSTIKFIDRPCEQQQQVVDSMKRMIATSILNGYGNRLITIIAGPNGTGKSQIAKQFAKAMNATVCDDYNPSRQGENFITLIKNVKPSKETPLVILIEEFDKIITKIHEPAKDKFTGLIQSMTDKPSYNMFMDRLSEYDNVFLVITMNSSFKQIDDMDISYTRYGRVDLKVNFGGDDTYNPTSDCKILHIQPFINLAKEFSRTRFEENNFIIDMQTETSQTETLQTEIIQTEIPLHDKEK